MRLLLVGSSSDRARLRSAINGSMEIAGEFASLAAARASEVDHDGILVAEGFDARPEPFDSPLILSQSQDEPLARDRPVGGRARKDQPWSAPDDAAEEAG